MDRGLREYGLDASGVGQHAHLFPSHLVIISNGWLCKHISLHINVNYVKVKFNMTLIVCVSFLASQLICLLKKNLFHMFLLCVAFSTFSIFSLDLSYRGMITCRLLKNVKFTTNNVEIFCDKILCVLNFTDN